jgi:hypothetical protein
MGRRCLPKPLVYELSAPAGTSLPGGSYRVIPSNSLQREHKSYKMAEVEELQKIKAVIAKPTEEGVAQLLHLMEASAFDRVKVEAAGAILEIVSDLQAKKQMKSLLFGPKLMGWISTGYLERPRKYWRNSNPETEHGHPASQSLWTTGDIYGSDVSHSSGGIMFCPRSPEPASQCSKFDPSPHLRWPGAPALPPFAGALGGATGPQPTRAWHHRAQ